MPKPTDPRRDVWIVRHGQSTFNEAGRYQGSSDEPELTSRGRGEARATGQFLAQFEIADVVSSPLRRASSTAEEIAGALAELASRPPVHFDARLKEISLPGWEGLFIREVRKIQPLEHNMFRDRPEWFQMPNSGGFPVRELFSRTERFWDGLPGSTGPLLIVTHGGTAKALISVALGLGPDAFHCFQVSNCGISRLRVKSGGTPDGASIVTWNATAHLGQRLPKLKEGRTGVRFLLYPAQGSLECGDRMQHPEWEQVQRVLIGGAVACDPNHWPNAVVEFVPSRGICGSVSRLCASAGSGEVITAVVVAEAATIRCVLETAFGFDPRLTRAIAVRAGSRIAVHCPAGARPVLQAVHFPVVGGRIQGEEV